MAGIRSLWAVWGRRKNFLGTNCSEKGIIVTSLSGKQMAANLSEIRASAGAIGGRHPASELQKQVASQTARNCKPWMKSTGAKSELGKFITARNSSPKPGPLHLNRMIDSRTEPDFALIVA